MGNDKAKKDDSSSISVYLGLGFSLLLLLIGIACRNVIPGVPISLAHLIVIAAISIMLGVFGGQATVKHRGITMGGVMAMTFILLNWISAGNTGISRFEISSEKDLSGAAISVQGDKTFYGATIDRSYQFIVEGESVPKNSFDVFITFPKGAEREQDLEYSYFDLPINYINSRLGSGEITEWKFNPEPLGVGELREVGPDGVILRSRDTANLSEASSSISLDFFPSAHAFENKSKKYNLEDYLLQLESGSASVRRNAREEIANMGEVLVPRLLQELSGESLSYLKQLGLINSLNRIASSSKDPEELFDYISELDIRRIVDAFQYNDPTMSRSAEELLIALGDPRVIPDIIKIAQSNPDPDLVERSLAVITSSYERVPAESRDKINAELRTIYDNTSSEKARSIIETYTDPSPTLLSGEYTGQWGSSEYSNYGNITIDLEVNNENDVKAVFSITGGVIEGGTLNGSVEPIEPGTWRASLKNRQTTVSAIIRDGQIHGEYDARFYLFWTDSGWWKMSRAN